MKARAYGESDVRSRTSYFFVFELDAEGRLLTAEADRPQKAAQRAET